MASRRSKSQSNNLADPNSIMVSGPINVLRLEGGINGVKKVIYLFMDYHVEVDEQLQCSNVFSTDVQKYFAESFYDLNGDNEDITYDFFLEIYPSELTGRHDRGDFDGPELKDHYIEEVVKFFRKIFNYDPKKNRVVSNQMFSKIRLHYLDVRNYYEANINEVNKEIASIVEAFVESNNIPTDDLQEVVHQLDRLKRHLILVLDVLSTKPKVISKSRIINGSREEEREINEMPNVDTMIYLTDKIKNIYSDKRIQTVMNELLAQSINNFKHTIEDIDSIKKTLKRYIKTLDDTDQRLIKDSNSSYIYTYGLSEVSKRNIITNIVNETDVLADEKVVEFFARFTDIYFLRRFLDKPYITNAIVYCGAMHTNTYVHTLVNKFNFKITHASYSKGSIADLNSQVKRRSLMEIRELILPPEFSQCSDLTNFPKKFA